MPMKKQTAAQRKAVQAAIDYEEAVEAERERRRAERSEKALLERRLVRSRRTKAITGFFSGAAAEGRWFAKETLGVVAGFLLLLLVPMLLFSLFVPSSLDLGQRITAFLPFVPMTLSFLWTLFVGLLGQIFLFAIRFTPYFLAFVFLLLLLKLVVFPLVRFIIRKVQN
jgi:hypothetical protein